ncbi:MAG: hypothetical protein HN348_16825 [Proteobacteria bacterium]|jgi:hypothetical protein|nr:hypothetical protein [Pseudomonadota bacterium]
MAKHLLKLAAAGILIGLALACDELPEDDTLECGDITEDGLCEGETLKFCLDDELVVEDCEDNGFVCDVVDDEASCI